jgi:hypothetical protein
MKMLLERVQQDAAVTIGSLSVDGDWECWTCEDAVREVPGQSVWQWKVAGQTAIPRGTYEVKITPSARFKRDLPILLSVPGFDGIRIHLGNTAADTEGCILPGADRYATSVGRSRVGFDALFVKIKDALAKGERVTIEIA